MLSLISLGNLKIAISFAQLKLCWSLNNFQIHTFYHFPFNFITIFLDTHIYYYYFCAKIFFSSDVCAIHEKNWKISRLDNFLFFSSFTSSCACCVNSQSIFFFRSLTCNLIAALSFRRIRKIDLIFTEIFHFFSLSLCIDATIIKIDKKLFFSLSGKIILLRGWKCYKIKKFFWSIFLHAELLPKLIFLLFSIFSMPLLYTQ